MSQSIPVLLYHSVPDRPGRDQLAVGFQRFAEHMRAIACSSRVALTIGQLAAGLRGACPLPERAMAITFDDGYANNLQAIERVCDRGLRCTAYVATGNLGRGSTLGVGEVRSLWSAELVEIGAHSITHQRLDELPRGELREEVCGSRERLQQLLGEHVDTFAYPYGAYDLRVRATVISAGYRCAAAVKNALSHPLDDPWAIARWTVGRDVSAAQLAHVLDGSGVQSAWQRERLRTFGYRKVRRARRALTRNVQSRVR